MSDKTNELIGTTWDYQGVVGSSAYNPQHAGRWKVTGISDDGRRVVIKQNCCEVAGKPGSRFYVEYSSKKCMEIPIKELQDNFKLYKEQNIIVEPKPSDEKSAEPRVANNGKKNARVCVMTNKDIVKTIDDNKTKAWTDDDIEAYLAKKGIKYSSGKNECSLKWDDKCKAYNGLSSDEIVNGLFDETAASRFAKAVDIAFGKELRNMFLEFIRKHERARPTFSRSVCDKKCRERIRKCPSGYENDGPCRHELDASPEPRCSNFECEGIEKKPLPKIPLRHRKPFNLY